MARSVEEFQTIHTEGAILPPDVLQRIATGELEGLDPATYHLPSGSKTKEAISQSWTRLLRYWKDFQAARKLILQSDETGALATREKWLLPLFQELGYGRLATTKAPEIDGKLFPIERFWQHIPIHLIGCKLQLDHRTKGARGAATAIPHSIVQEFLNRSAEHAWAFLSNGLQLRVLRDSAALSRQSYVEFDLESMMDGEVYADFAVLWLVCHQSRLEGDKPEDFWLEKWSKLAQEQGTRILEDLRIGVQKAIVALGRGFISHPLNEALIARLQTGSLTTQENFLEPNDPLQLKYDKFFPRSRQQQEWDAVGRAEIGGETELVLVEAKAHCGEIVRKGSESAGESRKKIEAALNQTKHSMGVSEQHDWIGGYYQYANRIATLHFLNSEGLKTHLVFLYFTGDDFTGRTCPATPTEWEVTIDQVKANLGLAALPPGAYLMDRIHEVFVPVLPS